ncbi:MAG: hypothetical protein QW297_06340 [Candidatus Jordarchaeales archaeon]
MDIPGQRGNGTCVVTSIPTSQGEYVHFNASASWSGTVYFNISQADSTFYRPVSAVTSYAASLGDVSWNVTVDATGEQGFPDVGLNSFINVSIPADWWNSTPSALNETGGRKWVSC